MNLVFALAVPSACGDGVADPGPGSATGGASSNGGWISAPPVLTSSRASSDAPLAQQPPRRPLVHRRAQRCWLCWAWSDGRGSWRTATWRSFPPKPCCRARPRPESRRSWAACSPAGGARRRQEARELANLGVRELHPLALAIPELASQPGREAQREAQRVTREGGGTGRRARFRF